MYTKYTKTLLFLLLLPLTICYALTDEGGQSEFNSFIPSSADELVNLATGDFSYKIPLLEVETNGGQSFPVTLFYQSGIGLEQEASWVGLGWNINVGAITRSARGLVDDYSGTINRTATRDNFSASLSYGILGASFNASMHCQSGGGGSGSYDGFSLFSSQGGGTSLSSMMNPFNSAFNKGMNISKMPLTASISNGMGLSTSLTFYLSSSNNTIFHAKGLLFNDLPRYNNILTSCQFEQMVNIQITDGINAYPYQDFYNAHVMPIPTNDRYSVNCEGISGTFSCFKQNDYTETIPWQSIGNQKLFGNPFNGFCGYVHSMEYIQRNQVSNNLFDEYCYRYLGEATLETVPINKSNIPRLFLDKPKKVFPIYESNIIVGFRIIDENGNVYKFGKGTFIKNINNKQLTDDEKNWVLDTQNPNYYTNWVLESITGADYIDMGEIGLDDNDKGFWIEFKYEKITDSYVSRTPFDGPYGEPPSYFYASNGLESLSKCISQSTKSLSYLRNIVTNKFVAVFTIAPRQDGFCSDGNGGSGLISSYKLENLKLYNKDAFKGQVIGENQCWDSNEATLAPIKCINFKYNYELCPQTPNSKAGVTKGKLTLTGLQVQGINESVLPPYTFKYYYNPTYDRMKFDRWGFYKANGYLRRHKGINNSDATAWSLNEIVFPVGEVMNIEYESDKYNFVHNTPLAGTMKELTECGADPNNDKFKGVGRFFSEDTRPTIPNDVRLYEVRSFAPGGPITGNVYDLPTTKQYCSGGGPYMASYYTLKQDMTVFGGKADFVTCMFEKDEIPSNFNLNAIMVDAYCGPSVGALDPEIWVEITGWKDGAETSLMNSNRSVCGTFQWNRRISKPLVTHVKYDAYEVRVKMQNSNAANISGYQRDLRVYLIDSVNTVEKRIEKYGGGIRVKKITYSNNALNQTVQEKEYFYDESASGYGVNTGVATIEPEPFSHIRDDDRKVLPAGLSALIPGEVVYYGKVTVVNNKKDRTVYEFITPQEKPITLDVKYKYITDVEGGSPVLKDAQYYDVEDNSFFWGVQKSVSHINSGGSTIQKVDYVNVDNYGQDYEEIRTNRVVASVAFTCPYQSQENVGFDDVKVYISGIRSKYPRLFEVAKKEFGVTKKDFYYYNIYNGLVNSVISADANNSIKKRKKIDYAFNHYEQLGQRNMLSNVAAEEIYDAGNKLCKYNASTYKSYNQQNNANKYWYEDAKHEDNYVQWYKECEYNWKSDVCTNDVPVFDYSGNDIDGSIWNEMLRNEKYLTSGKVSEVSYLKNRKKVFAATIYGDNVKDNVAYVENANMQECGVFTGDYHNTTNSEYYWDYENGWEIGTPTSGGTVSLVSTPADIHFGQKVIKVENNYAAGRNNVITPGKAYKMTAWVKVTTGPMKMAVSFHTVTGGTWPGVTRSDGVVGKDIFATPVIAAGQWQLLTLPIPAEWTTGFDNTKTWIARAWVGNIGGTANVGYVDDIRFAPENAMVTSTYYDQLWQKPIVSVDANNNPGKKMTYDTFGRPVKWEKIDPKKSAGEAGYAITVQSKKYHLMGEE